MKIANEKRVLTADQQAKRDERRAKFRALWKQVAAIPELERVQLSNKYGIRTVDGRELSMNNQCLLAIQKPGVSVVGGFRQWLEHGRAVRKGEHGAMIWVPCGRKSTIEPTAPNADIITEGSGEMDTRFIIGTVFDIGQTEEVAQDAPKLTPTEHNAFPNGRWS